MPVVSETIVGIFENIASNAVRQKLSNTDGTTHKS
jgi:hypothetical protein